VAAGAPALVPGAVQLWQFELDAPALPLAILAATLSEDERERATRFVAARDRERFVAGRGLLRVLLGGYAGIEPASLRFTYWERGKPALAAGQASASGALPCFNLAHAGGCALLAVAVDRELGVDLEAVDPALDWEPLARGHFAAREVAALLALPETEQRAAFYRAWALKEAWAKARGEGLAAPLDAVDVAAVATGRAASARAPLVAGVDVEVAAWTLQLVEAGPGFAAALAAPGAGWRLERFRLV
jgi:4'-phosphopantetheinyl transferase